MDLAVLFHTLTHLVATSDDSSAAAAAPLILLISGFLFFGLMYSRYRNADKRHWHETETVAHVANLAASDLLLQNKKGLSNSKMKGANHIRTEGALNQSGMPSVSALLKNLTS